MKDIVLQYERKYLFAGFAEVTLKCSPSGAVYWCSHWELIDDLAKRGLVRREYSGAQNGHCEYYIDDL